jgi:hypothetical protein
MTQKKSRKDNAKKTVPKWSQYDDARKDQSGGKYPNYWTYKGREGHTELRDGSEGAESWTFQHRGGSMIQFMPDGAIQVITHNGKHEITFGENRVKITGAHDVTVDGDGSYKTKGDGGYNETHYGPSHTAAGKASVETQESVNIFATKHFDVGSESMSLQSSGPMSLTASHATMSFEKSFALETEGGATITAKQGVGGGGPSFSWSATGQGSLKAGSMVAMDAPVIHLNSGYAQSPAQAVTHKPATGRSSST